MNNFNLVIIGIEVHPSQTTVHLQDEWQRNIHLNTSWLQQELSPKQNPDSHQYWYEHWLLSDNCKAFSSGIDIKDIPNVNDRDFSITLNGFFLVRWRDPRLIIENVDFGENEPLIPVDVSLVDSIWMPDIEILNLKEFATLDVLSKLEGLWLNQNLELIYAVACRITWICPMTFDSFPLDVQVHTYLAFVFYWV